MHEATPPRILAANKVSGKGLAVATITEDTEGRGYLMMITFENDDGCEFSTHPTIASARERAARLGALVIDRTLTEDQLADRFFYGI